MPRNQNYRQKREPKEYEEKVIQIKRLSKKTKGGNKISFSSLVVIGNRKGRAGIGLDKASDVLSAIKKSIRVAKRNLVDINLDGDTIPHEINLKNGAARILLKPAPQGTGVIAGGPIRAVVEAFGIKNIVSKRLGSTNKAANVVATMKALQLIKPAKPNSRENQKKAVQQLKDKKIKSSDRSKPVKSQQPAKKISK
jgi:small subunit ribosomal protein S5